MQIEAEGVSYDNQLIVHLNGNAIGVLLSSAKALLPNGHQAFVVNVPDSLLQQGDNKVQFSYNTEFRLKNAKVAVYNFGMQWY